MKFDGAHYAGWLQMRLRQIMPWQFDRGFKLDLQCVRFRGRNVFELTKFAGTLLSPLFLVLLGEMVALVLVWRGWRRTGMTLAFLSLAGLWLAASPWAAESLTQALERQHPAMTVEQTPPADAALVLGGALAGAHPPERPYFNMGSAADRLWHAAALYRAGKVRWILLSGGNQPGFEAMQSEADAMREMLLARGVPAAAILLEGHSRNTMENASYSKDLVLKIRARRVLLVTSAMHMPRALAVFQGAFRDLGVEVLPATTDVEVVQCGPGQVRRWLPDAGSLALGSRAVKEYLGTAFFRWKGMM